MTRTWPCPRPAAPWAGTIVAFVFVARDEDPLDHEVRRSVYDHIQEYPGLHLSQVARDLDLTTNHAKYHLRVLEERNLITSARMDGYWRFYPREEGRHFNRELIDADDKEVLSLLRRDVPFRITVFLLEHGEGYNQQFAEAAEVSPSTSKYHLDKMEEAGMVEGVKDGRSVVYELEDPDRVRWLLDRYEPPDRLVEGFLEAWEALEL